MKYYYEYKEKNGCKVGGHNLEKIDFLDKNIFSHWATLLDMKEIEYLKIEPMLENGEE